MDLCLTLPISAVILLQRRRREEWMRQMEKFLWPCREIKPLQVQLFLSQMPENDRVQLCSMYFFMFCKLLRRCDVTLPLLLLIEICPSLARIKEEASGNFIMHALADASNFIDCANDNFRALSIKSLRCYPDVISILNCNGLSPLHLLLGNEDIDFILLDLMITEYPNSCFISSSSKMLPIHYLFRHQSLQAPKINTKFYHAIYSVALINLNAINISVSITITRLLLDDEEGSDHISLNASETSTWTPYSRAKSIFEEDHKNMSFLMLLKAMTALADKQGRGFLSIEELSR